MSVLINPYALAPVAPAATREYRALKTGPTVNASSYTITGCDVGSAAPGRYVVAYLFMGSFNDRSFSAVTIGGATARIVVQRSWQYLSAYYRSGIVIAPLDVGATADIAVTLSGGSGSNAFVAAATYKTLGLQSNVEIESSSNAGTGGNPKSLGADVQDNGLLFSCAYLRRSTSNYNYSGVTEDFESVVGTDLRIVGGSTEITADATDYEVQLSSDGSFSGSFLVASFR